jgi:hypothetical protein
MPRSATAWHQVLDRYGRTILYITSDECTVRGIGVCSIHDRDSDVVSYRLMADGSHRAMDQDSEGPFPERGLVVLGTSKFDRPTLTEVRALTGLHGAAAADAIEAREYFRQARHQLGLTLDQMAGVLGYKPTRQIGYALESGQRRIRPPQRQLIEAYLAGHRPADWPNAGRPRPGDAPPDRQPEGRRGSVAPM